jgi:hypothetical protein
MEIPKRFGWVGLSDVAGPTHTIEGVMIPKMLGGSEMRLFDPRILVVVG